MSLDYKLLKFDDIENAPIQYSITYDGRALCDDCIAEELSINLDNYLKILKSCGAIRYHGEYNFLNEDDAMKATVALKLILNER